GEQGVHHGGRPRCAGTEGGPQEAVRGDAAGETRDDQPRVADVEADTDPEGAGGGVGIVVAGSVPLPALLHCGHHALWIVRHVGVPFRAARRGPLAPRRAEELGRRYAALTARPVAGLQPVAEIVVGAVAREPGTPAGDAGIVEGAGVVVVTGTAEHRRM